MAVLITPQTATMPNGFTHTGDGEADRIFVDSDVATTLFGGAGADELQVDGSGLSTLYGDDGADVLRSSAADSLLFGGDGDDTIIAVGQFSTVYGGEGRDDIEGGSFGDALYGGADFDVLGGFRGDDRLYGGALADVLFGGDGDDYLDGGSGSDILRGEYGNDTYVVNQSSTHHEHDIEDSVYEWLPYSLGGGIDTVCSYTSFELPEYFEILRLVGEGEASGIGNHSHNVIVGNASRNYLSGGGGDDRLLGNEGHDILVGNSGSDTLVGGEGSDTFIYTSIADSRAGAGNRDFINGIDHYRDVIDLRQIDANTYNGAAVNDAWTWIGADAFDGTWGTSAGQLRVMNLGDHNAVIVEGDHNGDGVADFQIFVNGTDFMSVGDFLM